LEQGSKEFLARTLSPLKISREQFLLLRSSALKQGLPSELTESASGVVHLTTDMISQGYFQLSGGKLVPTPMGLLALRRYSRGKIPLIDPADKWLLEPSEENLQYRLGSSLAEVLAKRVSSGEAGLKTALLARRVDVRD
jgi:hypothetical protein